MNQRTNTLRMMTTALAAATCLAASATAAPAPAAELDKAIETVKTATDPQVRNTAVQKLGELKDPKAIPVLIEALAPKAADMEKDWFVAKNAVNALVAIGKPSLEPLMVVTKHENAVVRKRAIEAVARLKPADVVGFLSKHVKGDPDPRVRAACVFQLRDLKDKAVLPVLQEVAAKDADADVKRHAKTAIEKIQGGA